MTGTLVVGIQDLEGARPALDWAAKEAARSGRSVRLVQAWGATGGVTQREVAEQLLHAARDELLSRQPAVDVSVEPVAADPVQALLQVSRETGQLVLGTRGLGAVTGFLLGSVSLPVVARSSCPVVLVRAEGEHGAPGPGEEVVVGVKRADRPDSEVLQYAFAAAAERELPLRAVYAWRPPAPSHVSLPAVYVVLPDQTAETTRRVEEAETAALSEALRPWRQRYPQVSVVEEPMPGAAGETLVAAAGSADLVVVGRGGRAAGVGPRVGPVVHALLHHAPCPVVAVPHP